MQAFIFRKIFILLLLSLGFVGTAYAQDFSYVYIQGDKKTPIYAKVEGVMIPRYGKNYALIARLAPGPMNIEILFKQNAYPPVQFNILVPENGKRAFVLTQKEGVFALFDVVQNFYLPANNTIEEDHLPALLATSSSSIVQASVPTVVLDTLTKRKHRQKTKSSLLTQQTNTDTAQITTTDQPAFIQNITFNNEHNEVVKSDSASGQQMTNTAQVIINSDCKSLISQTAFVKLWNALNAKNTEDERLGFIIESLKQYCISVAQAQQLVGVLSSDVARFSALKTLYPKINDQINFPQLGSLLASEEWKAYFKTMLEAK